MRPIFPADYRTWQPHRSGVGWKRRVVDAGADRQYSTLAQWHRECAVGKYAKVLQNILCDGADANIRFADLVQLLARLGFAQRIRGDHSIFTKPDVEEIINLQPKGGMAKNYQVKQVRNVILKYRLGMRDDD